MPDDLAATRLLALLGHPVAHSFSPAMQNAALRALGLNAVYVALRCGGFDLPGLLAGIARAGGGGNVTVPHKEKAAAAVQRSTAAVERTGACNTYWLEDGRICGDNTDVEGFRDALGRLVGSAAGARVLLLGAGGGARAAAFALVQAGADEIVLVNRSVDRAADLRRRVDPGGGRIRLASAGDSLMRQRFDVVVNATSVGLTDGAHPYELVESHQVGAVLDLVYRPGETEWVRHARTLGIPAADGLEMLLAQGAASFRLWWRREPPLDVMREALRRAATPSAMASPR